MFKLATSYLGISFLDYYDATPREISLMFEGQAEKKKQEIEMQELATRIAIINAMSKKNYKVFGKEKEVNKMVTIENKSKELNYLKNMFY